MAHDQNSTSLDPLSVDQLKTSPPGRDFLPGEPRVRLHFGANLTVPVVGAGDTAAFRIFNLLPPSKFWVYELINFVGWMYPGATPETDEWQHGTLEFYASIDQGQPVIKTRAISIGLTGNTIRGYGNPNVQTTWSVGSGTLVGSNNDIGGVPGSKVSNLPLLFGIDDVTLQPAFIWSNTLGDSAANTLVFWSEWLAYDANDMLDTRMFWSQPTVNR